MEEESVKIVGHFSHKYITTVGVRSIVGVIELEEINGTSLFCARLLYSMYTGYGKSPGKAIVELLGSMPEGDI